MHISVLSKELIDGLNITKNGIYVDCTFGNGGHSEHILKIDNTASVIALDRDQNVKDTANKFIDNFGNRFKFYNTLFSDIDKVVIDKIDGIIYDIGVSSMQLDQAERGFSFNKSGPLTMQMGLNDVSAEYLVNKLPEYELANLIYKYGDERKSRFIAKKIAEYRTTKYITDTLELADIIKSCVGRYNDQIHPATRTFQALRIATNNELQELEISLKKAINLLKPGARICVITFHSLEDKIVKDIFNEYSGKTKATFDRNYSTNEVENDSKVTTLLKNITKKPIIPSNEEINLNIRARSAKLRIAEKICT